MTGCWSGVPPLLRGTWQSFGVLLVLLKQELGEVDEVFDRNFTLLQRLVQLGSGNAERPREQRKSARQAFTNLASEFLSLDLAFTEHLAGG